MNVLFQFQASSTRSAVLSHYKSQHNTMAMITYIALTTALYLTQTDAFSAIPRRNALQQIQSLSIQPLSRWF